MADIINKAQHYNNHPSGVECGEISWQMTATLCQAFQYGWRYYDKGDPVTDLKKMLFYVKKSFEIDNAFLLGNLDFIEFFRNEVMTPQRRTVFNRPSPWCEPVRLAMAGICDLHCTPLVSERVRIYDKVRKCLETAIEDEQCMGRAFQP